MTTKVSYLMMDAWVNSSDEAKGRQKEKEFNKVKRYKYKCIKYVTATLKCLQLFWHYTCTLTTI